MQKDTATTFELLSEIMNNLYLIKNCLDQMEKEKESEVQTDGRL